MICRMKKIVPKPILIDVYNTTVLPHFDYCRLVFFTIAVQHLSARKIAKNAKQGSQGHHWKIVRGAICDVLKEIGWQSVEDRRKFNKLIFMHKVKCKAYPDAMTSMFNVSNNIIFVVTILTMPFKNQTHANIMKKSIAYPCASVWNSLHGNIKRKQLMIKFGLHNVNSKLVFFIVLCLCYYVAYSCKTSFRLFKTHMYIVQTVPWKSVAYTRNEEFLNQLE